MKKLLLTIILTFSLNAFASFKGGVQLDVPYASPAQSSQTLCDNDNNCRGRNLNQDKAHIRGSIGVEGFVGRLGADVNFSTSFIDNKIDYNIIYKLDDNWRVKVGANVKTIGIYPYEQFHQKAGFQMGIEKAVKDNLSIVVQYNYTDGHITDNVLPGQIPLDVKSTSLGLEWKF